jgi:membrane protein DedA with SNARE-associated domain
MSAAHLDQRDADPVTGAVVLVASPSAAPGGIAGHLLHVGGGPAYALIGLLAFAEAALMVGFFIPGETAVVVGGVLAGLGRVDLALMIVVVVVCAIVGDSVGFEVGRLVGPWLLEHRPLAGSMAVRSTLGLLDRYGGPAIFIGRFVTFARAVIPGLAGMSGLRYRTFLFWNVLGATVWGVGYTVLGYVVGVSFEHVLKEIGLWSLIGVGALLAAVVGFEVWRRRRVKLRLEIEFDGPRDGPRGETGVESGGEILAAPPDLGAPQSDSDS